MIATYVIIAAVVVILATWEKSPFKIYWKTESGRAFVRTGMGGAKPVIGGGALVIPLLHKIQWVDLSEVKLVVRRAERESIISKDHLRVDLTAEFYVRVRAEKDSVRQAAVGLGRRADNAEVLRDFLEPNLLDTIQTVASEMTLDDMHDQRGRFARQVKELLLADMELKGLELINVSLTSIDQTDLQYYDPDNIFDSEGLLTIKDQTENRKKIRNDIEREQALLIEQKNVEVRKRALDLERERAFAEQDTRREIEIQKDERDREITESRFGQRLLSEEAQINHDREFRERELAKERYIEEQRVATERAIELAELSKRQELEKQRIGVEKEIQTTAIQREIELTGEKRRREESLIALEQFIEELKIERDKLLDEQRISKERELKLARVDSDTRIKEEQIARDNSVRVTAIKGDIEVISETQRKELSDMEKTKAIELARRTREVAIAGQEKLIAEARTEEARAKSLQEEAEQETVSIKVRSQADRQKLVTLIRAEEQAKRISIERESEIGVQAEEIIRLANARLEAAGSDAKAMETLSVSERTQSLARAEGEQAMVNARNLISEHILKDERARQLIGELAKIAAELMRPAEKIDSIKVVHVDGLGTWQGKALVSGEGDKGESLLSQAGSQSAIATIINGILQIGAFKPVFQQLLGDEGISDLDNTKAMELLRQIAPSLLSNTGRELARAAIQEEQDRKKDVKSKKEKKED